MTAAASTIEALHLDLADPTACEVCEHDPARAVWAAVCVTCGFTLDQCEPCKARFEHALHEYPRLRAVLGEWGCKSCATPLLGPESYTFRRLP